MTRKVRPDDYRQETASVERGLLRITTHRAERTEVNWATGDYVHPMGIVAILRQAPDRSFPNGYTRLDAVVNGRLVYRSWEREWADHSIPKLARQLLGAE